VTLKVIEGHRKWRDLIGHKSLPISVHSNKLTTSLSGSNFAEIFGISKLDSLSYVILCLAVLVEHRLVTDTDTDRHTRTQAHG